METDVGAIPPQIWSPEGVLLETLPAVSDTAVRVAFLPHANAYWQVGRGGEVRVYDARGPVDVTTAAAASNAVVQRRDVRGVWAAPHSSSAFAATPGGGLVHFRCARGMHLALAERLLRAAMC